MIRDLDINNPECSGRSTATKVEISLLRCTDPAPTCGVSGPATLGENVTLTCSVTYYFLSQDARLTPGAGISASISWEPDAGTFLSNSSTDVTNDAGTVVGKQHCSDWHLTVQQFY